MKGNGMITPGPWEMVDDDGWTMIYSAAFDGDGDRIPVVDLHHGGYDFAVLGYPLKDNALAISLVPEMIEALKRVEPHLDAIVCFASTMDEHEPNRIAHDVRTILSKLEGKTDE